MPLTIGAYAFQNSNLNLKFIEEFPALETIGINGFNHLHWSGRLNLANKKDKKI